MRDLHLRLLALTLATVGAGLCYYKVTALGLPLQPQENTEVWTVQARLHFEGRNEPAKLSLTLPEQTPGFIKLDEDYISSSYGLTVQGVDGKRHAQWAKRRARGPQTVYYRISLAEDDANALTEVGKAPKFPAVPEYPETVGAAVTAILAEVRAESADIASFTTELLTRLNAKQPDENVKLLREGAPRPAQWVKQIREVLKGAKIPSRRLTGLRLADNRNLAELQYWLQVHDGEQWLSFDPFTGEEGLPKNFLLWSTGDAPLFSHEGVRQPELTFSIARSSRRVVEVASKRAEKAGSQIMELSLFSLPLQTQNVYRILLTVPIGALLVVLLRNVVGLRTFGTFMPILIALAFRETQLAWGLVLFTMLVAIGLMLRFYLERLLLLLVPRLAAVLTIVVLLMVAVSIISQQLGAERALSIALFPMVILAMTIERMSLVWEEHGPGEAILQGGGSLAVASLGYLCMTHPLVTHLVFVFPELLLVVLAVILLLGRYSGYRLSELWRFRGALTGHGK